VKVRREEKGGEERGTLSPLKLFRSRDAAAGCREKKATGELEILFFSLSSSSPSFRFFEASLSSKKKGDETV
jgi:hypothetical protein